MRILYLPAVVCLALASSEALGAACAGFSDVSTSDAAYCAAVTYLKDKAVTLGCDATHYCPNDGVTRLQMALFMQRAGRGGVHNVLGDATTTIGGGDYNGAEFDYSVIGGGYHNIAEKDAATVSGGTENLAHSLWSSVGGGYHNWALDDYAHIGGGDSNEAAGHASTVGGGMNNTADGNYATVAGGRLNAATGNYSVALGYRAKALGSGTFVFADANAPDFSGTTANSFRVRATGGVRFVTDIAEDGSTNWSCVTSSGSGWSCSSDRNLKQNLAALDGSEVLRRVAALPMYRWQPKGRNEHVMHFGPMAQDFYAAFGLGDDDRMIGLQDADGVALAAIQGLNAKVEARDALIADQARELSEIRAMLGVLLAERETSQRAH